MAGYLGNPKLIAMTQDNIPVANFEYPVNPTATINPIRVPVTWLNTTTGCRFICTDNTTDANVWKLMSGFRGALVKRTTAQTISHDTSTPVQWDQEEYDTDDFHDNATNNTRLTIPAGVSRVQLRCLVAFGSNSATGYRAAELRKNGGGWSGGGLSVEPTPSTAQVTRLSLSSAVTSVSEGDYFEINVYQTQGSNLDLPASAVSHWFSIEVIE